MDGEMKELKKYPAHEIISRWASAAVLDIDRENCSGSAARKMYDNLEKERKIVDDFLQSQQQNRALIRELVEELRRLSSFNFAHQGAGEGPLAYILIQAHAAIQKAEAALKEQS